MSAIDSPDPDPAEIQIQNPNRYAEVRARRLRPWLARLVEELAPQAGGLGVRFVSDRQMRQLNRDFRGVDRPTDVLSFPENEEPGRYLGDIVVSVPTARRQASESGRGVGTEIRTLLPHGVLHCLGHDHETDSGQMSALESRLRARWIESDG